MALPSLNLADPLVTALIALLSGNGATQPNGSVADGSGTTRLNATIATFNSSISDSYSLQPIAQFLPYLPIPSLLEGGTPVVGVSRLGGEFMDDLQVNMDAVHRLGVMCVIQNADQGALARQLERTLECIAYTIQQDRLAGSPVGTGSVMKQQGGAWAVNFDGYEAGPVLGEKDPTAPPGPPSSFLSWDLLLISARRTEI